MWKLQGLLVITDSFHNTGSNFQCNNQQGEGLQRTLSLTVFYYLQTI